MPLSEEYEYMTITELLNLVKVGKRNNSASVKDFEDLIVEKYYQMDDETQDMVTEGGGMLEDDLKDLRELLIQRKIIS